ncbi:MAG: hypothetical protein ACREA9_23385 [Pyrinomonadaceae bacterium]
MKKAEVVANAAIVANVAIIVTATLLCVVLIKQYLIPQPQPIIGSQVVTDRGSTKRPPVNDQVQPGTKFSLTGIDWAKNGKTLVLAVSDKCHFCSESAPFYQRLC